MTLLDDQQIDWLIVKLPYFTFVWIGAGISLHTRDYPPRYKYWNGCVNKLHCITTAIHRASSSWRHRLVLPPDDDGQRSTDPQFAHWLIITEIYQTGTVNGAVAISIGYGDGIVQFIMSSREATCIGRQTTECEIDNRLCQRLFKARSKATRSLHHCPIEPHSVIIVISRALKRELTCSVFCALQMWMTMDSCPPTMNPECYMANAEFKFRTRTKKCWILLPLPEN